jgi:hypothetical protein
MANFGQVLKYKFYSTIGSLCHALLFLNRYKKGGFTMERQSLGIICCAAGILFCVSSLVLAQDLKHISLPQPGIGWQAINAGIKEQMFNKGIKHTTNSNGDAFRSLVSR